MLCPRCGKEIRDNATTCAYCGCAVKRNSANNGGKDWLATLLLVLFLGTFGVHRFYTGHIGIGVAQLLTLGGCGIWTLWDWIYITFNKFKDHDGNLLNNYRQGVAIIVFLIVLVVSIVRVVLPLIKALNG